MLYFYVCCLSVVLCHRRIFVYLSFSFLGVLESTALRGTVFILSFQNMFAFYILQHGHLLDGYLVEFLETLALRHAFMDKDRI